MLFSPVFPRLDMYQSSACISTKKKRERRKKREKREKRRRKKEKKRKVRQQIEAAPHSHAQLNQKRKHSIYLSIYRKFRSENSVRLAVFPATASHSQPATASHCPPLPATAHLYRNHYAYYIQQESNMFCGHLGHSIKNDSFLPLLSSAGMHAGRPWRCCEVR